MKQKYKYVMYWVYECDIFYPICGWMLKFGALLSYDILYLYFNTSKKMMKKDLESREFLQDQHMIFG